MSRLRALLKHSNLTSLSGVLLTVLRGSKHIAIELASNIPQLYETQLIQKHKTEGHTLYKSTLHMSNTTIYFIKSL